MTMNDWAEHEIELACKFENPNWDGKSFDYGCSCYQSALKAYKSLCEDDHSGYSFSVTKNILIRLMNGLPLRPITEADFENTENLSQKENLKQCPRMSSLFREVDKDGNIRYSDVDRVYCIDINTKNTYHNSYCDDIVNELYPIKLPYYPVTEEYKVYTEDFLTDRKNGDFDTRAYLYMLTPEKKRIELNIFKAYIDGQWVEITKEQYEERKKNKL